MSKVVKKQKKRVSVSKKKQVSLPVITPTFLFFSLAILAVIGIGALVQQQLVLSSQQETGSDFGPARILRRVTVEPKDLDSTSSNPAVVATDGKNKWFLYNDTNDTIDNTLGTFITGPAKPFFGKGSVEFTLGASPLNRKNVATYQFSGTPLAGIKQMSFGVYSHSGVASSSEDPFLNFNVDFTGSSAAFQKRLVYVPSVNGTVTQDTWQKWDAISGGKAQWTWSGYISNGSKWLDGNTSQYRTWKDIVTAFPHARLLPVGGWLGIRVGEPGPTGYTADVDFFSITNGNRTTIYDFEPEEVHPSRMPTPTKSPCDNDGWKSFHMFSNASDCHRHEDDGQENSATGSATVNQTAQNDN